MKIIFSPEYSGTVYAKAPDGNRVMMDMVVTNTIGLVGMLELRLGLHYEEVPEHERVAYYYNAVCRYMKAHPQNVMAASFKTSGLSTTKAMLAWRDQLREAKWNFDGEYISERIAVLIGIEEEFCKWVKHDMASRLHVVTDQLVLQQFDASEMTIIMPVAKELLKPAVGQLIEALESRGATIELMLVPCGEGNNLEKVRQLIAEKRQGKIVLDEKDESILVYKFADERSACEYLAYHDMEEMDVWINAHNKQMDDWMGLMNRPRTGSCTEKCLPQLTQLFVMGMGMFASPLNVSTLIEWLNMPIHPLERFFRTVLADTIIREGGYRNEACRKVVERYVEGGYVYLNKEQKALSEGEQLQIIQKGRKGRLEKVDIFLPPLEKQEGLSKVRIENFVKALAMWARQQAHLIDGEQWTEQLMEVVSMCEALSIMIDNVADENMEYKTIDSWMSTICQKATYTHAIAEVGCRTVVDAPTKIASTVDKTVWMGVEGDADNSQECAFLYPTERKALMAERMIDLWDEEAANNYYEQMMLTPLRMTREQLILVVRERIAGEVAMKHPFIVRLEQQIENFDSIVRYPEINVCHKHKAVRIDNSVDEAELSFDYADKMVWPDHLSPTSIGTLVEHPLDYLMGNLLCIKPDAKAEMADVKTVKGNVAHAVIEHLFAPRNNEFYSTPSDIKRRIEEYDAVYDRIIEGKGAILQLTENRLGEKLFREQLRNCIYVLLEIIEENALKVTACELYAETDLKLALPAAYDDEGNPKDRDMLGYIDMTLEDRNGLPVVIDFKWTSSQKWYQTLLKENRSVQLELYRTMLERKTGRMVERVAYFVMPEAHLYSKEVFEGKHCSQLDAANADAIVEQLQRGALYRKQQLERGVVEMNGVYEELQYVKDTPSRGLFPLKKNEKEGTKETNIFSQYGLFNK